MNFIEIKLDSIKSGINSYLENMQASDQSNKIQYHIQDERLAGRFVKITDIQTEIDPTISTVRSQALTVFSKAASFFQINPNSPQEFDIVQGFQDLQRKYEATLTTLSQPNDILTINQLKNCLTTISDIKKLAELSLMSTKTTNRDLSPITLDTINDILRNTDRFFKDKAIWDPSQLLGKIPEDFVMCPQISYEDMVSFKDFFTHLTGKKLEQDYTWNFPSQLQPFVVKAINECLCVSPEVESHLLVPITFNFLMSIYNKPFTNELVKLCYPDFCSEKELARNTLLVELVNSMLMTSINQTKLFESMRVFKNCFYQKISVDKDSDWPTLIGKRFFSYPPETMIEILNLATNHDVFLKICFLENGSFNFWNKFNFLKEIPGLLSNPKLKNWISELLNDQIQSLSVDIDFLIESLQTRKSIPELILYSHRNKDFNISELECKYPLNYENAVNYTVRKSGFAEKFGYNSASQADYGAYLDQSVYIGKELILQKCAFTFLVDFFAYRRSCIAYQLKQLNANQFGVKSSAIGNLGTQTPCHQTEYSDLNEFFEREFKFYNILAGSYIKLFTTLNGSIIEFAEIHRAKKKGFKIYHNRNIKVTSLILNHVETLFNSALYTEDTKEISQLCGQIFWWICQAKPWLRGDPSIAEMLFKTVFLYKNIPIRPWKIGVVPWSESMKIYDPIQFGEKFEDLFDAA